MTFWHVNEFLTREKGIGRDFIQGIFVSFTDCFNPSTEDSEWLREGRLPMPKS